MDYCIASYFFLFPHTSLIRWCGVPQGGSHKVKVSQTALTIFDISNTKKWKLPHCKYFCKYVYDKTTFNINFCVGTHGLQSLWTQYSVCLIWLILFLLSNDNKYIHPSIWRGDQWLSRGDFFLLKFPEVIKMKYMLSYVTSPWFEVRDRVKFIKWNF